MLTSFAFVDTLRKLVPLSSACFRFRLRSVCCRGSFSGVLFIIACVITSRSASLSLCDEPVLILEFSWLFWVEDGAAVDVITE